MSQTIILEEGKTNEITIYHAKVEEQRTKENMIIVLPTNQATPLVPTIVDLLRVRTSFVITGRINSSDIDKIRNITNTAGVFTMKYGYEKIADVMVAKTYNVNFEKWVATELPEPGSSTAYPTFLGVNFTVVVGRNYTS